MAPQSRRFCLPALFVLAIVFFFLDDASAFYTADGTRSTTNNGKVPALRLDHSSITAATLQSSPSQLNLLPVPDLLVLSDAVATSLADSLLASAALTTIASNAMIVGVSPEPIHAAFSVATFLPQPFWLLLTLWPNQSITKKIMGGLEVPLLCCLIHFFIVAASIVTGGSEATAPLAEFNQVFDPSGDPQAAFMGMTTNYPNFVAEEWSHVLTWDLFVGRYIWLDGLKRGIWTAPAVLFCNLIGPPGLLIHWLACTVSGKPIFERSELEAISDSKQD